jgi:predicted dehydrogenase
MRFAILGSHPDGLELADALVNSGRHQVVAYTAEVGDGGRRRWGDARKVSDLEEVLADPNVEAVVVAGQLANRSEQLRRSLQSERHVLCVHPLDQTPESAYEAAMIQNDTKVVLLPLLPEALHPAVCRLADFIERPVDGAKGTCPVGAFRLLEVERTEAGEVLFGIEVAGQKPSFPGWDVLRALGGEIAEVSAFAAAEDLHPGDPVLLAGRFERGGLFQLTLLPARPESRWSLAVVGERGRAELTLPLGWQGPALLDYCDAQGEQHEEYWERWDPWPTVLGLFEARLAGPENRGQPGGSRLDWQDAVRCLELDDAARRSVQRRRASQLEYPEASEEVGFKGTMTLVGCGLVWVILLLLLLSRWVPAAGYFIVVLLVVFLGLQLLRYVVPRKPSP